MRLLLDTHTFVWWDSRPERLPKGILRLCEDRANTLVLSVASVWELQIKTQLGKLVLARPLQQIVRDQQSGNGLELLSVQVEHVYELQVLPLHHKDPFDRLLIAQAIAEGMPLLSMDTMFRQYPIQLFTE